jgi:hypothetical protein
MGERKPFLQRCRKSSMLEAERSSKQGVHLPEEWPRGAKLMGPSLAPSWQSVRWLVGRSWRMWNSCEGLWSQPPGYMLFLGRKSAILFARRSIRSVMARLIGYLSVKKWRPFTMREATAGQGVPRFAALQPGSLLMSSWISKKGHNSSSFSEVKCLKGSAKI